MRPIHRSFALVLLAASCAVPPHPVTVAEHERQAQHYDDTADSIETECWKARRNELTVNDPDPCWKAQDIRFLEANRNAAAKERAEAARLRSLEASR
jgi:hypothetical protein